MPWFRRPHRKSEERGKVVPLRAHRFPLRTPVRYRRPGDTQWHSGTTENVSCTGVLFRGRQPLPPATPVVLQFRLPRELTGEAPVDVACQAMTVRSARRRGECAVAAAILDYQVGTTESAALVAQRLERMSADEATLAMMHAINNQMTIIVGSADLLLSGRASARELTERLSEMKHTAIATSEIVKAFAYRKQDQRKKNGA